jgi:ribosomal protein S18 acetylase RimI-like enzyme
MEIIKLIKWNYLSEKLLNDLKEIYENSFPVDERRDFEKLVNLENNPLFSFFYFYNNNVLSGLFTQWIFNDFCYIEHLAIREDLRDKGIGTLLMKYLTSEIKQLLVIEVEKLGEPNSDRRIKFYLNIGFYLCEYSYIQPPYSHERNSVPMNLMTYPRSLIYKDFLEIRKELYLNVYNFEF